MRFSLLRFLRFLFQRLRLAPRALRGAIIGLLCALVMQVLVAAGWLQGLESGTFDALFRLRGPRFGASEIVLVMADDATVSRYKQWPLPRRVHARLVRDLKKAGAKTIAYDLLFATPSGAADDDDFARACREAGVVQSCAFHLAQGSQANFPVSAAGIVGEPAARFALSGKTENNPDTKIPSAVWMNAPLPELMSAAPTLGHVNIHPEKDGVLRRVPHVLDYRGRLYPSLALATAIDFLDLKPSDVRVEKGALQFSGRAAPRRLSLDAGGETWVNWAGGYRTFATFSMVEVLDGKVPPEVFKNRIVMIGATAASTFEWRATPFSPSQPAMELQANALDNILLQRPLTVTPDWVRLLLMVFLATITGALIAPRLELSATLLFFGIGVLAWIAAWFCFARENLYLPIAPALLASALTYSLAMAINYREEWEANWRADASVAALARGGALMISGRNRAELEAVIRDTAREALQAEEAHLIFDLPDENSFAENSFAENSLAGDSPGQNSASLQAIARHAAQNRHAVFHPAASSAAISARDKKPLSSPPPAAKGSPFAGSEATWVAAAIGAKNNNGNRNHAGKENQNNTKPRGILIATGRREGRAFTARDAAVMETLADQAALALESLEYYELLQSRVDLANRDLSEAYGVLSSQSARFMAAVESMDDAFLICDASHRVVFVNGAAQSVLRESTPDLGDHLPQVFQNGGWPQIAMLFDELEKAPDSLRREYSLDARVLSVHLTPLTETENSARAGAMLMVSDVSSQRELDRMKTDFVGFVAHELRSPLGTIMGYASLLQQSAMQKENDPAADLQAEATGAIDRQCRRLNRMVNDLLDIARLEAGHKLDLRRADIDVVDVCKRAIESQRAAMSGSLFNLSLQCDLPEVKLFADPDRIEQILINLLSNAVKYSPSGGEVVLSLTQSAVENKNEIQISISDQGMGMTREQVENLFQKFYRTPEAKARNIKGTGLGLFLVKQLVESHDGTIAVESEPGKGTTFRIILPRRAAS